MSKPLKNTSGRKVRSDMKIGKFEQSVPVSGLTKKEFFRILDKASQPIKREAESDSKKSQT
jgi:hypothetical protein